MPLLPPSVLRRNPLVGWEDRSGLTSKQAQEPYALLLQPGAKERYAEVYNRVGLPLAVDLSPEYTYLGLRPRKVAYQAQEHAKRVNAIVLSVSVPAREGSAFYRRHGEARGDMTRTSPYTPFVLLHRLGDALRNINIPECSHLTKALDSAESNYDGNMSRGVDTAAGRMGVVHNDHLSDLWAKWLLTGRLAYSATNPPPDENLNDDDPGAEARFRNMVAEYAPQIFRSWYEYLMKKKPMVIDI